MNVHEHILLWNQAFIKIIDIRHTTMVQKEQLRNYRFPASTFLYTVRGAHKCGWITTYTL